MSIVLIDLEDWEELKERVSTLEENNYDDDDTEKGNPEDSLKGNDKLLG